MSAPPTLAATGLFPHAVAPAQAQSRAAIAQAAARTGVDFDYLLGQAKLESSLDPNARARTSSASGLYQFIDSTWLETLDRHGARLGYAGMANAIEMRGGRARVSDPAQREAIMALRFDPQAAALMAGALASDNRTQLTGVLGREPEPAELYLAHFLGAQGAETFLTALGRDPDTPAASLLPRAARANRAIFYQGGTARSLQGVMQLFERKMDRAMEGAAGASGNPTAPWAAIASPTAVTPGAETSTPPSYRHSSRAPLGQPVLPPVPMLPDAPPRESMADMLQRSFGETAMASSAHVQRAYGKLRALGL